MPSCPSCIVRPSSVNFSLKSLISQKLFDNFFSFSKKVPMHCTVILKGGRKVKIGSFFTRRQFFKNCSITFSLFTGRHEACQ